ncbi:MAG TPA: 3-hydroxyacyl-CoA dehydrogenase family protein [Solirubrobacteraceae bacterium]|nr:3-hydroxyacyl-CoA dehydrogenase family protein [Solirubrobacteraceae bacterium]
MTVVGVAGAGTMGAGIAALAAARFQTRLYDPDPEVLARAPDGPDPVSDLDALADCDLVIEAAPEDLDVKRSLFQRLAEIVAPGCVLATNTSSLSVTALAATVPGPERVVGMHFFNPPQKMRLLEVVAGDLSGPHAVAAARAAGEAMGKHVIEAADGPGFIVNRCNRPFSLEAMRIVQEGAALEDVDAACRRAGFRMGPFAMMDLVGIDVGFAVARSFYDQSFGEPRWRPSLLAARLVAAGRLGRKTGRGWYEYPPGPPRVEAAEGDLDPIAERIVCQLVNEAYFALGEGVGTAEDIDAGMVLGLNHPRGPFEWGETLGRAHVVGVLTELRESGGDAYRPAPLLARGELRH